MKWVNNPIVTQQLLFKNLFHAQRSTQFGIDHQFNNINSHEDFINRVPITGL